VEWVATKEPDRSAAEGRANSEPRNIATRQGDAQMKNEPITGK